MVIRKPGKSEGGFSLIELMVVIAVVSIIATMAALGVSVIRRQQVSSAAKELIAAFQQVRVRAKTQGPTDSAGTAPFMRGVGIRLISPTSYAVFKFNDCDEDYVYDADTCATLPEEVNTETETLPSSVEIMRRKDDGQLKEDWLALEELFILVIHMWKQNHI